MYTHTNVIYKYLIVLLAKSLCVFYSTSSKTTVRNLVFVLVGAKRVRSAGFQAVLTVGFRRGECPAMSAPRPQSRK